MTRALSAIVIALSLLLLGCGPAKSLFPLFTDSDQLFDGNAVGEWREVPGQEQNGFDDSPNTRWIVQKTQDRLSYDFSVIEFGKAGAINSTARLVKLGDALFVDFGPGSETAGASQEISYPQLEAHAIGRIWIEKDDIRIRLLDEKWAQDRIHDGTFPLSSIDTKSDLVITATTEQLRRFASENAENMKAFSVEHHLVRVK